MQKSLAAIHISRYISCWTTITKNIKNVLELLYLRVWWFIPIGLLTAW